MKKNVLKSPVRERETSTKKVFCLLVICLLAIVTLVLFSMAGYLNQKAAAPEPMPGDNSVTTTPVEQMSIVGQWRAIPPRTVDDILWSDYWCFMPNGNAVSFSQIASLSGGEVVYVAWEDFVEQNGQLVSSSSWEKKDWRYYLNIKSNENSGEYPLGFAHADTFEFEGQTYYKVETENERDLSEIHIEYKSEKGKTMKGTLADVWGSALEE